MTIAIDIDDTITETSVIAAKYLKEFDSNYDDYHNLPKEKYEEYMRLYQAKCLKNASLKEGIMEAFAYFNKKNYKIIIITARDNKYDPHIKDITLEYLKNHNLKYNKIFFGESLKGETAQKEHVDIFIDDKETVLDDVSKYHIETINIGSNISRKHKTFSNWSDIIKYIKHERG